ncbi:MULTISPECIES: c-type cytochrome [unclassified Caulobacter]|uniref:c-type cytochrome n=1 Tax=unclassified Caulobacter TaxID=2648921 RepID=UPI000D356845|nr:MULTISPECIES: cytochrome c family protein [unclassified Caulobacter]PTS91679.1 cytochrome c family protein [Caulobacter sp. HMWF009]PTT06249.1 cytochrome c family protein [Caulobacter sp. HMWF025]
MLKLQLAATAALCLALTACSKSDDKTAAGTPTATPAVAEGPTDAQKAAALASLPAPYNTGDLANGQRKFALCRSCHTIAEGGPSMTGPNLYGVFGRKAGSVADYSYSDPVKAAGFIWDGEHLDKWLADPRGFMPGTKMSFAGVKDPKDRIDLIAYLKVETGYKPAS